MGLIAMVLIPIVLFFWFAACFTLWAWLQTIFCLCQCKFIRATIWFSIGTGMLFWWMGTDIDWNTWLGGSAVIVGMGVITSLLLYIKRHSRPTVPAWTRPIDAVGSQHSIKSLT
jgi:hypothetical protein